MSLRLFLAGAIVAVALALIAATEIYEMGPRYERVD